jgi:hypothetical protein
LGKDFRIIFLGEKIEFKRNYQKRHGQGSSATDWHNGKMGHDTGPTWEGKMRWERKADWLQEIGPKDLREYRK